MKTTSFEKYFSGNLLIEQLISDSDFFNFGVESLFKDAKIFKYLSFLYQNKAYPRLVAQFYLSLQDSGHELFSIANHHTFSITPDYLSKNCYLPDGGIGIHNATMDNEVWSSNDIF